MRLLGRRHWTEVVTVHTVTHVTSGRGAGGKSRSVLHHDIRASVQPASNADALRHGLTTDQPTYWVRFAEAAPRVADEVVWRGDSYRVAAVSGGPNIDTELLVTLGGGS